GKQPVTLVNHGTHVRPAHERCRNARHYGLVSHCWARASTRAIWSMAPAAWTSRSKSVVLPASTCAEIPKFSVRRTMRHTLRIGRKALRDGHERWAHLL